MREWDGTDLDEEDRANAMAGFSEDVIDSDFLPFLREINSLPFVASVQCCIGHLDYNKIPAEVLPSNRTTGWGYLQLMTTLDAATWISEHADWDWLWNENSQLFSDGTGCPETTGNGSFLIAFAWDASAWPAPALDIVELLNAFYDRNL